MSLPATITRFALAPLAVALLAAATAAPSAAQTVKVVPTEGATNTTAQVRADGLPPNSDVQVLGGGDRNALSPLNSAMTDPEGRLEILVKIPGDLGNGDPYYLAVKAGDQIVLADPPFRVVSRTGTPPSGAGGMMPLQPSDRPAGQ